MASASVTPIKIVPKCQCGHSKYVHKGCFKGACVRADCGCQSYKQKNG